MCSHVNSTEDECADNYSAVRTALYSAPIQRLSWASAAPVLAVSVILYLTDIYSAVRTALYSAGADCLFQRGSRVLKGEGATHSRYKFIYGVWGLLEARAAPAPQRIIPAPLL